MFNHCSKRYYWPFEWFSKSSFIRCFRVCQEVLDITQIAMASTEADHHLSSSPDCRNTADVPSFTRRTDLLATPFVSDRWGVDVPWFHDKASHAFPNSIELSVYTTFGACDDSKNFKKFFPSHVKILFCTDKIESIEWLTTIAYRWSSPDSHPSSRTLWSAVIKSPNFSVRGRASPVRLLQVASVIWVLKQTSQFRS